MEKIEDIKKEEEKQAVGTQIGLDPLPLDHPKNQKTVHDVILGDKDASRDFNELETSEGLCTMLNKGMKMVKCFSKPEWRFMGEAEKKKLDDKVYYNTYRNGFISSVAMAYNYHLPLMLSPNDIWLVVFHGFGLHMKANKGKKFMSLTFKDLAGLKKDVRKHMMIENAAFGDMDALDALEFEDIIFKHMEWASDSIWNKKHCSDDFSAEDTSPGTIRAKCGISKLTDMYNYESTNDFDLKMKNIQAK